MAREIPILSRGESLRLKALVLLPNVLQGLFSRRPGMVAMCARLDADRRGYELLERLRGKHGDGVLRLHGGKEVVLLDPELIAAVLDGSPEPWGPPGAKRKGMGHFQPAAVTLATGADWRRRRRFNETVLETGQPLHHLASGFLDGVREEVAALRAPGALGWPAIERLFESIALRVIFGRADDGTRQLAGALNGLMKQSNRLVGLRHGRAFATLHGGIERHLEAPHPGSLLAVAARGGGEAGLAAGHQVPHWMFAMGGTLAVNAGRALAVIAARPAVEQNVRRELAAAELADARSVAGLEYLGGCLKEAMRLWPTTPLLAREAQSAVELAGVRVPAGGKALIPNIFNHRDPAAVRAPHDFVPERWQGEVEPYRFNHLSNGPQVCAGAELAIFLGVAALAHLLAAGRYALERPRLAAAGELPFACDQFKLRLRRAPSAR